MSDKKKTDKSKRVTVGDVATKAIKAGKTNEEALAAVKAALPEAKTSLASINWYRNKARAEDKSVPTARELKKKAGDKKGGKKKAAKDPLE